MVNCCVKGCRTRCGNSEGISLFRLPKIITHQGERDRELTERRRCQFLANIHRRDVSEKAANNMRICSRHFVLGKPANFRDETNVDWAPTLFLGHDRIPFSKVKSSVARYTRALQRRAKKRDHEAAETLLVLPMSDSTNVQGSENKTTNMSPLDKGEGHSNIQCFNNQTTNMSQLDKGEGHSNIQCFNNQTTNTSPLDKGEGHSNIQCFNNQTANTSPLDKGEGHSNIQCFHNQTTNTSPLDKGEGHSNIQCFSKQTTNRSLLVKGEGHSNIQCFNNPTTNRSILVRVEGHSNIQCFNNQTTNRSLLVKGEGHSNIQPLNNQTTNTSLLDMNQQQAEDSTSTISARTGDNTEALYLEIQQLRNDIYLLREKVKYFEITQESFVNDDNKVKFYTGLRSYDALLHIFNNISGTISHNHNNCLTKFQEFVLTLMKLRLSLPLQDLSYRFKISWSTASRIFEKWVRHMARNLIQHIVWPEREDIQKTMPSCFKNSFGADTAIIIDCFEIVFDKPPNMSAKAWAEYKDNNTVKFLLGITPQCTISFISKSWGGRFSDERLTENSGILNHLLPGDLVLASRGFTIADGVGFYCAKLAIPDLASGKKQLSALEISKTKKNAKVRSHVERITGLVRQKYKILSDTLPSDILNEKGNPLIDDIVTTCCALINLCPSVAPTE
ncbi:uncharacterized protein LOC131929915 [Physella acuta]|uniref:uncharacterized protein LOC131929915 n=1 Tax=Physella acuta TaxID=109671 RepID=UPI0027DE5B8C|nr:uncharacterized protein LOC131929915 [Physella acuta]